MPPRPARPSSPASAAPALLHAPPDGKCWWCWWCVTAECTQCPVMSQKKVRYTVNIPPPCSDSVKAHLARETHSCQSYTFTSCTPAHCRLQTTQQQYQQDFSQRQGGQDLHINAFNETIYVFLPSNVTGLLVSLVLCQLEGMWWIFPKAWLRCIISPTSLQASKQPNPPHVILVQAVTSW